MPYRGRIAPSPTGFLHLGHAATFAQAWRRARQAKGTILLRIEDLDHERCRREFTEAITEDLTWWGLNWDEGPGMGGPFAPYTQSERRPHFLAAWKALRDGDWIYPSPHSRKDVAAALSAPQETDAPYGGHTGEAIFPPELRPGAGAGRNVAAPAGVNWRFRVPDGEAITFTDGRCGAIRFVAGRDFGDFVVWRRDDVPAYELAVVVDDHAMAITEVVRGEDLLLSTARQLLLYRALGWNPPAWWHAPLIRDAAGRRLAKRHAALSLRSLRAIHPDAEHWKKPTTLAEVSS
ncbi:MAG: tRNA glutamyl-Q synthetase [Opitutales bacterium]|nr:tRNA glutamyl-Q synthetase [Opitutales bacterium]